MIVTQRRAKMIRKLTVAFVVGAAMLVAAGCQNQHRENLKQAEARWSRARASVMMQLAEQQFKSGQLDKALVSLGKALELDPNYPQLQVLRGQILAEKGQNQAALAAFELAIAMDSQCGPAHYHRGLQFEHWGQFERAAESYAAAQRLEPSNVAYAVAEAEMLGQLGRTADALELLDGMLVVQEQSAALRVTAGELCLASGQPGRAASYLQDAARLAPGDGEITRSLGLALYRAGRHDQARGYLEPLAAGLLEGPPPANKPVSLLVRPGEQEEVVQWSQTDAAKSELLGALGDCYLSAGLDDKAERCFQQVARTYPRQSDAWQNLAKVEIYRREWAMALAHAGKAVTLAPNSASAQMLRGYCLSQLGRHAEAAAAFESAHRLDPRDVLMLCLLGESQIHLGRPSAARETLVRALQIAPTDPLATRMMRELARAEQKQSQPLAPPIVTAGVSVQE